MSNVPTTKTTSDKNMFVGGRRPQHACVRQGRCQKTPTLMLLAEVLRASAVWAFFFSLKTMYFELLFEVLALMFRKSCKTGGSCHLPFLWPPYVFAMAVVRGGRRKGDPELRRLWPGLSQSPIYDSPGATIYSCTCYNSLSPSPVLVVLLVYIRQS